MRVSCTPDRVKTLCDPAYTPPPSVCALFLATVQLTSRMSTVVEVVERPFAKSTIKAPPCDARLEAKEQP